MTLPEIQQMWTGTRWFIEGDISKYFDTIDHDILMTILGAKLHDNRFLRLIRKLLEAGYMEEWKYNKTLSGTPQGGVLSPLLANIYLNKFDQYVETVLIPAYTRGEVRKRNPAYVSIIGKISRARRKGDKDQVKMLQKQQKSLPSIDPNDPNYRRLRYIRYADDFLLGFSGPKHEAEDIKQQISSYLQEHLKLQLSQEKTLITHATNEAARFLGYEIVNQHSDTKHTHGKRYVNGTIGLRVPRDVILKKCAPYLRNSKPIHRPERMDDSDFSIVERYQQEYRGIVQYYLLALNVSKFQYLRWVMESSLLKTLAVKHQTTVGAMAEKYQAAIQTPEGETLKCLEVAIERVGKHPLIARFGGISLRRQPYTILDDQLPKPINTGTEILQRLQANVCELCESNQNIQVHHIRKLADLKRSKGGRQRLGWKMLMIARQRKTLVVCRICHIAIHTGTIDQRLTELGVSWNELLESRVHQKV